MVTPTDDLTAALQAAIARANGGHGGSYCADNCDAVGLVPIFACALLRLLELQPGGHDENCKAIRMYYCDDRCECDYRHWQAAIAELRAAAGMEEKQDA